MKTILSLTATLTALLLAGCAVSTAETADGEEGSAAQAEELKTEPVEAAQPEGERARSDESALATCTPRCRPDYVCVPLLSGKGACVQE